VDARALAASLTPGSRLGAFEVLGPLGAGGMGEVYEARDTRLDRTVALKVLPAQAAADPDARQRFEREARSISRLNHPHICTLHDVGSALVEGVERQFLIMERLEGETLATRLTRGALPVQQALAYGIEIADALAAAHGRGVVHRDLKPANIMLTKAGVKLLDFGLARLRAPATAGGPSVAASHDGPLTRDGTVFGTLPYMAPEQVRGEEADARTDLFAFGAVLYEMITGARAFVADSEAARIAAILEHDPPPLATRQPDTPPALERLVATCLAKDPDDRWQHAHDVALELKEIAERPLDRRLTRAAPSPANVSRRWAAGTLVAWGLALALAVALAGVWLFLRNRPVASSGTAQASAIVVLPFQMLSGAEDEYVADGIAEAATTALARVKGLLVISRNSAATYKGRAVDPRTVGKDLAVSHVLGGTVQRSGERLRVSVQLAESSTGRQVWAEQYERQRKEIFALQDAVSIGVARALHPGAATGPGAAPTANLAAYDEYLRGRFQFHANRIKNAQAAIERFERATALDPQFGLAYAALATAYVSRHFYAENTSHEPAEKGVRRNREGPGDRPEPGGSSPCPGQPSVDAAERVPTRTGGQRAQTRPGAQSQPR
jgi:TolB-like protein